MATREDASTVFLPRIRDPILAKLRHIKLGSFPRGGRGARAEPPLKPRTSVMDGDATGSGCMDFTELMDIATTVGGS
jgi:hypothetical protein